LGNARERNAAAEFGGFRAWNTFRRAELSFDSRRYRNYRLPADIYQNIAPSDPLSFRKNYSESAERLVGCRRLTVSGLVASTWGIISSVSGMSALLSSNSLFWGLEGETLRAATIATMGFNFIFGAISALISIVLTITGICRLICGEIMLINGLLRSVRELYKNSDKAVALSVLSCIPAANIAAAAIILKKVQSGIKSGTLTQCDHK